MGEAQGVRDDWTTAVRWVARLLALLVVVLFVWFLVESGPRLWASLAWDRVQGVPLVVAMLVALTGVVLAWRWELWGGLVTLLGSLGIVALVVAGSGLDMIYAALLFTAPMLVAAALYLGCCARDRTRAAVEDEW
jgi:peptidoglycan/LPS O-acetylase OafA/YrhL